MGKKLRHRIAILLTILFVGIISAPTIIMSINDNIDMTSFYSLNEEEENEHLKLVFDNIEQDLEDFTAESSKKTVIAYAYKTYPKPHLNLISPPPELA